MNIRVRLVDEWDDEFYRRFPLLFADILTGTKNVSPLTESGIECRPGWRKVVESLCASLEAEIAGLPEDLRKHHRAIQIKQKFGVLRVYMSNMAPRMIGMIHTAEEESAKTCEECGRPGSIDKKKSWRRALCKACEV